MLPGADLNAHLRRCAALSIRTTSRTVPLQFAGRDRARYPERRRLSSLGDRRGDAEGVGSEQQAAEPIKMIQYVLYEYAYQYATISLISRHPKFRASTGGVMQIVVLHTFLTSGCLSLKS